MKFCSKERGHLGPHACTMAHHEAMAMSLCASQSYARFKDRRPCPMCGHVAVRYVWPADPHGKYGESVSSCSACRFESAALKHEYAARKLRAKAAAILARRTR